MQTISSYRLHFTNADGQLEFFQIGARLVTVFLLARKDGFGLPVALALQVVGMLLT